MSAETLQKMIEQVQALPETDQERVLQFIKSLRAPEPKANASDENVNDFIVQKGGGLVFTGELLDPSTDYLRVVREEYEDGIIRRALGGE